MLLEPGNYKLAHDVKNPEPDRRVKGDWRSWPVWPAGAEFIVASDIEYPTLRSLIKADNRWTHQKINMSKYDGAQWDALSAALVPCEESDAQFFRHRDCNSMFGRWLVESKAMTRAEFDALWTKYMHDDRQENA